MVDFECLDLCSGEPRATVGGLIYRRPVLVTTVIAMVVAAVSAVVAVLALRQAERSADAAEGLPGLGEAVDRRR